METAGEPQPFETDYVLERGDPTSARSRPATTVDLAERGGLTPPA
jgi:hypothetical protein